MTWIFERVAGPAGPHTVTEGPVWDGSVLLFAQIETDRIMSYNPASGEVGVHRTNTGRTNGLALDSKGRLYGCSRRAFGIVRFEPDGTDVPLPNVLDGVRINRPSDIAIDSQDRIWFTNKYGLGATSSESVLDFEAVMRLDPTSDSDYELKLMTRDIAAPNGIILSQDERTLYVSQLAYRAPARELRAYPLLEDDSLGSYRVMQTFGRDMVSDARQREVAATRPDFVKAYGADGSGIHRGVDGMCLDEDGNIIAAAGWQEAGPGPMIYVFSPEGRVLETHPTPSDWPTNCAFGDPDLGTLYITTGGGELYRVRNTGRRGWDHRARHPN